MADIAALQSSLAAALGERIRRQAVDRGQLTIEISAGENLSSVTAKINDATAQTGVVASQTSDTANIALRSQDYGSANFVRVSVLEGDTTNFVAGNDEGVDASVSVNGQSAAVDGLNVNFSAGNTQTRPNEDLAPERLTGGDVGVMLTRGRVSARVTGFWNVLDEAITSITLSSSGRARSHWRVCA